MNEKAMLLQVLSQKVIVEGELIPGRGEDSYLYLANEEMVIVGVFDGCGGSGAKRYPVFGGHTGAYLASRAVCGVVQDWFNHYAIETPEEQWLECLKKTIKNILNCYEKKGGKSLLRGSMIRKFPTTAAIAVCRYKKNRMHIRYIWAGDSRGYLLSQKGLFQMTADDVDGEDAMSNLVNDGVLTNVISASEDFILHSREITVDMPCAVFSATDGCFNYLPSPMHFEFLLLDSLLSAESIIRWEQNLGKNIRAVSGDDHDLAMVLFGYGEFEELSEGYCDRVKYLLHTYIEPWENLRPEEQQKLWQRYQKEQMTR